MLYARNLILRFHNLAKIAQKLHKRLNELENWDSTKIAQTQTKHLL